jgi:acetyl esterase/lipase
MRRLFSLLIAIMFLLPSARADDLAFTRQNDVVYGHKFGVGLIMDVFTPKAHANGAGVIWVISGGWFSAPEMIGGENPPAVAELTKRGYVVFAVMHGSQPKYTIPEILLDMNRSVRFIRYHAKDYKIDPNRIGITGGSAGGHLSLMQGTAADEGDTKAKDPIDRVSSRVQAVACFFPPTDFLNYGSPGENAIGRGVLKPYKAAFDFKEFDDKTRTFERVTDEEKILEIGRKISPINFVSADDPPTLILHGDKDNLVPIQQSESFIARMKEFSIPCKLVVHPGGGHGWAGMEKDLPTIANWFDQFIGKKK